MTCACALSQVITTIAGTEFTFPASAVPALNAPLSGVTAYGGIGVAVDVAGNVYASDAFNNIVVQISASGTLRVIAGNGIYGFSGDGGAATSASLAQPSGVAVDPLGNVYIADTGNHRIRKVSDGTITTFAGGGSGPLGDGGPASSATVTPFALALDAAGNLYIAEPFNICRIRKVTRGIITTVAGNGICGFSGDGALATNASLNIPTGVALDSAGNLYIADSSNYRVRKVSGGLITTVAGGGIGGDGGPATEAGIFPMGVALDSLGNLYIADYTFHVRKVSAGIITTIAGNGVRGFSGDGGAALKAALNELSGLAIDSIGTLYIADAGNKRIRRIGTDGIIRTIAGNEKFKFSGDGGPPRSANLQFPRGLVLDSAGNVYVADTYNNRVRNVSGSTVMTVVGNGVATFAGDNGPATSASLNSPVALAFDLEGSLYIADTDSTSAVRKVSRGTITTVAGLGCCGFSGDGGPAISAGLDEPSGLAVDPGGSLYIADAGNSRIRKVSRGIITTIAGNGTKGFSGDGGLAVNASLNLLNFTPAHPSGVAVDSGGNIYIADSGNNRVRKISNGIITTVAGNGTGGFSGDGGPAVNAQLYSPSGVAVDKAGNLYIADLSNNRVRKVSAGVITTIAGNGAPSYFGDGGLATTAALNQPSGVAVDSAGNIYIADSGNDRIREVLNSPPLLQVFAGTIPSAASGGKPSIARVSVSAAQNDALGTALLGVTYSAQVSPSSPWLTVSPAIGSTPALITITADPANLVPGTYSGTITINAPNANPTLKIINVQFSVGVGIGPMLVVDRDHLSFTYARTSTTRGQNLTVSNRGGGPLPFTTSVLLDSGREANWLRVTPATGTATPSAPAALTIQADPMQLPAGTYTGRIVITGSVAGSGSASIPVTMTITTNPLILLLSQTGLTFTAVQSGGVIPSQTFAVLNLGSGLLNWRVQTSTLSGGNWLIATPNSGSSDAASASSAPLVTVSVNPAGLKPDVYYGLVKVVSTGAANTPQEVVVVLEVLSASTDVAAIVQPNALIFTGPAGKSSPSSQDVLVYDPTGTRKSFRSGRMTVDGVNWLATLPTDATIAPDQPTRIVVQPLVDNLTPGTYHGTLTLQFSDGRVSTVAITFVVTGAGPTGGTSAEQGRDGMQRTVNSCTPKQLLPALISLGSGFTVPAGFPQGLEAQVVDDCGNMHQAGKVVVEFSNGDPPVKLSSLNNGRWDGTWKTGIQQLSNVTLTVTAENPALQIKGQNQITGGLGTPRAAPVVADNGVVSAASLVQQAPLAPGGLISIFGQRLSEGTSQAPPVSTELASTTVTIGDQQLPLLYASDGQVNGVVPFGVNVNTNQQLLVQRGATYAQPIYVDIAGTQPAIFQSGQQGIIVDVKNNLIGPANPAHVGDVVVIYCSGLGTVDPPVADGAVTPGAPLSSTVNPVGVMMGGQNATVLFAGLTPGLVGLYQVNATVPQGVVPGDQVPVSIGIGGQMSSAVYSSVR